MSSSDVRRGRDQRQYDPCELPLYSDFSSDESIKEEKLRPVLRPRSPPQEQEDSSSPMPSGRSRKRRRRELASDVVEPLENYLHFEARLPSSTLKNVHEETQASKTVRSDDVTNIKTRKYPTIWDVMAGRVNCQGFIPITPYYAADRDTASSSSKPVNLRGWLLRNAPKSLKDADRQSISQSTPAIQDAKPKDDDLLRALHVYVSEFYAHLPGGEISFQSMDASALIAMAVLLEETMEAKVGEDGWRAFMEGENSLDEFGQPVKKFFDAQSWQWQPSVLADEDSDETLKWARIPRHESTSFSSRGSSQVRTCRPCIEHHRECDNDHPCASCVTQGHIDQCRYDSPRWTSWTSSWKNLSCFRCYAGRRLCDHQRPCGHCVKRGLEALCVYDGDSTEKMEAAREHENQRPKHAASVRSTPSRRASSTGSAERDTEFMDINDSQNDQDSEERSTAPRSVTGDSESVEMRSGLEVDTETKSSGEDGVEELRNPESDLRPAARKTGSGEMPAWLKRAIQSDEEEDEDEESEDDDNDTEAE